MPSYLTLTAAVALLATAASAQTSNITKSTVYPPTGYGYINYTTVTGYFLQDEPSTNATAFDYVSLTLVQLGWSS